MKGEIRMKEITAYQSDDGKFVGTYDEVLEYEARELLLDNIKSKFEQRDFDRGYEFVVLDGREDALKFLQDPDVKELFHLLNG